MKYIKVKTIIESEIIVEVEDTETFDDKSEWYKSLVDYIYRKIIQSGYPQLFNTKVNIYYQIA